MTEKIYEAAVLGGGIAGFEAALVLKTFNRDFVWMGSEIFGKKMRAAEKVKNFAGFSDSGKALAERLERQAREEGLIFTEARVDGVYRTGGFYTLTEGQKTVCARSVILATGVEKGGALLAGEREFFGRGVSYCAVCDGGLYRGKTVAAVIAPSYGHEAEYLAGFAEKVYCFCSAALPFRASNIERVDDLPVAVEGRERVERLVGKRGTYRVDGVFFLGDSVPASALVPGLAADGGHVKVGRDMSTNLPGLFAAGDVTGRPYQYAKAAGEGLVAAFSANEYLSRQTAPRRS